jgi:hypothetical protein
LDRSLTVLLPVHNVQSTLSQTVQELLDVLPEVSRRFDLVIIDDGSTDATSEVAAELAQSYPQVRVAYRSEAGGHESAIRAGLELSQGEVVVVRDDEMGMPLDRLHGLCQSSLRQDARQGQGVQSLTIGIRQRLAQYARRAPGYRVVCQRGCAVGNGGASSAQPSAPNYLTRLKKFAFGE